MFMKRSPRIVAVCLLTRSILIKWTVSSEFGTYRLCEQRRFRRACATAQSRQNLRCSLIQAVSQEEPSDKKPDPWPLWMAGHAQLKFVMTECSKTQIRLTGLKLYLYICIIFLSRLTCSENSQMTRQYLLYGEVKTQKCPSSHLKLTIDSYLITHGEPYEMLLQIPPCTFNPYLPRGRFDPYQLDEFVWNVLGVWCNFILFWTEIPVSKQCQSW